MKTEQFPGVPSLEVKTVDVLRIDSEVTGTAAHSKPSVELRSRDTQTRDGAGGFVRFQSPNTNGTYSDAVQLNGGLVSATAGNEQGDLDIACYVDGASTVAVAIRGDWRAVAPAFNDFWDLGRASNQWKNLRLSGSVVFDDALSVTRNADNQFEVSGGHLAAKISGAPAQMYLERTDTHGDSKQVAAVNYQGRDSAGNLATYGQMIVRAMQDNNGAETGRYQFATVVGGALAVRAHIESGMWMDGTTGGDKGAKTINAGDFFIEGSSVADKFADLEARVAALEA